MSQSSLHHKPFTIDANKAYTEKNFQINERKQSLICIKLIKYFKKNNYLKLI